MVALRAVKDDTTCHACKIEQIRRRPRTDRPPPADIENADTAHQRELNKPAKPCLYCDSRLKQYTRLLRDKVQHTIKQKYNIVHRPFNLPASAPSEALGAILSSPVLPDPPPPPPIDAIATDPSVLAQFASETTEAKENWVVNIRSNLRQAGYTYEYQAVLNILQDCQHDLTLACTVLGQLGTVVAEAYAELSPSRKAVMVRKFGKRMVSGTQIREPNVLDQMREHGWGENTRFEFDGWMRVRNIMRGGREAARGLRSDIALHHAAVRKAAGLGVAVTREKGAKVAGAGELGTSKIRKARQLQLPARGTKKVGGAARQQLIVSKNSSEISEERQKGVSSVDIRKPLKVRLRNIATDDPNDTRHTDETRHDEVHMPLRAAVEDLRGEAANL